MAAPVPTDDLPANLVPADDMPSGPVPAHDMPAAGGAIPTMTVKPEADPAKPPKPTMSGVDRFATGVMDPVMGAAQTLSRIAPPGPATTITNMALKGMGSDARIGPSGNFDQVVRDREADIQETTPSFMEGGGTTLDAEGRASHQPLRRSEGGSDPLRTFGNIASPMNLVAPMKGFGAASVGQRALSGAFQGMTIGAMQPVTGEDVGTDKAIQATVGGVVGAAAPLAIDLGRTVRNFVSEIHGGEWVGNKAVEGVLERLTSKKRGAMVLDDILALSDLTPDKPLVLADFEDANLKGLVGRIARTPGDAKDTLSRFVKARDKAMALRLSDDIGEHLGEGAKYYADRALKDARSTSSKEPFIVADAGGSIAPLETKFQEAFAKYDGELRAAERDWDHANQTITNMRAKEERAGDNVYGVNSAREDIRKAEAAQREAEGRIKTATNAKGLARTLLRQAQDDRMSGAPGAVWSWRLQEFIDQPEIQEGIRRGWHIERREAVGQGRPMHASEYGITGFEANGDPVVSKVPTFKQLRLAKEGLDAKIEEFRDPVTRRLDDLDKNVISYKELRDGLVKEMDALNPDYKPARDIWSGYSSSLTALRNGSNIFHTDPNVIEDAFRTMTPNEKEFYRLGAASKMREIIYKTAEHGDETRAFVGSTNPQLQMRPMFDTEEQYQKWINKLDAEHLIYKTWRKAYGGSETAERVAEDFSYGVSRLKNVASGAWNAARGHFGPAARNLAHAVAPDTLKKVEGAIADEQAELLTTPIPDAVARLRAAVNKAPPMSKPPTLYGYPVTPGLVAPAVAATQPDMSRQ